jgi:hypothetical protein
MQLDQEVVDNYVEYFHKKGEDALCKYIVGLGLRRGLKVPNPDLEILYIADSFFALYRSTGKEVYFDMGRVFRRAAHKIYRIFLKTDKDKEVNAKFLNMVR